MPNNGTARYGFIHADLLAPGLLHLLFVLPGMFLPYNHVAPSLASYILEADLSEGL